MQQQSSSQAGNQDTTQNTPKTKAMLKGWSSLGGQGHSASGGPQQQTPNMTSSINHNNSMSTPTGPPGPAAGSQGQTGTPAGRTSDMFNQFRRQAQEKQEKERQIREQRDKEAQKQVGSTTLNLRPKTVIRLFWDISKKTQGQKKSNKFSKTQ